METRDSVKGEKVLSGWCIGEEKTALSLNNLSISVKKGKFNNYCFAKSVADHLVKKKKKHLILFSSGLDGCS